ncbi:MAG: hypothetical protein K9N05_04350 [Candidatus Marinimicrobia bacterium]|nr:hypothetical protein [Candidatus Neomarinimicrobiota bacterium]
MKKFIKRIIIFLFFPFLLTNIFDYWLRSQNTIYKEKYNSLIAAKDSIQVIILGNSHANYGVDPTQFKELYTYNLANVSQSIYFDKRLTINAIDNGVSNLKFVFISIDYHSLFTSSQGYRNKWSYYGNGIKYKNEKYLLSNISPFLWGYTPRVTFSLMKKNILHRIKKKSKLLYIDIEDGVINKADTLKKGFVALTGTNYSIFNEELYQNRLKGFKEPNNSERDSVLKDLGDFIIYLKNREITPILFTTPTYVEYNKYLDTMQLCRNNLDVEYLCKKYNIESWDYMSDNRFTILDFYNQDHLNEQGSQKFSIILSNRLSLYVRTQNNTYK